MGLKPLYGKSGIGKTQWMLNTIQKSHGLDSSQTMIVLVPEQYTLQMQYELIQNLNTKGLMAIEVLSFERLAYRLNDRLAKDAVVLNDVGKHMLLKRLLLKHQDDFKVISRFAHQEGYIQELKTLLAEFDHYRIDFSAIQKIQDHIQLKGQQSFIHKLEDLSLLMTLYQHELENGYAGDYLQLETMLERILNHTLLQEAIIYVDGFYGFKPNQYAMLAAMVKVAESVTVLVTLDDAKTNSPLYSESVKVLSRLEALCAAEKLTFHPPTCLTDLEVDLKDRYKEAKALRYLRDGLYHYPLRPYLQAHKGQLYLSEASQLKEEIQYVADTMMKLIMEKGYTFRDMGIVTGDIEPYRSIIEEVFALYEIPFHMDQKIHLAQHPFVVMWMHALKTAVFGYGYEDVFSVLKAGFFDADETDVMLLENYCLAYGIKGRGGWQRPFKKPYPTSAYGDDLELLDRLNALRMDFITWLAPLEALYHHKDLTVSTGVTALQSWLVDSGLFKSLDIKAEALEAEGLRIQAQLYTQLEAHIQTVLEQLMAVLGDEAIDLKGLMLLLESGLKIESVGIVPSVIDQVVIGTYNRSRMKSTKVLFAIGLNEGYVPAVAEQAGILSEQERLLMAEGEIEMAPLSQQRMYQEQFNIYMGLIRGQNRVYLSYSTLDFEGKSMRKSMVIHMVLQLLPNLKTTHIRTLYERKLVINKTEATFKRLVAIQADGHRQLTDTDLEVYYKNHDRYGPLYADLMTHMTYRNHISKLKPKTVRALYGQVLENSVTRLERFVKCPFAHFVSYGLKLNERIEFSIQLPDIGIIFHKAIERFALKLTTVHGQSWEHVASEFRKELVETSVKEVVAEEQRGLFLSSARSQYLVSHLVRIVDRAVATMIYQINAGGFRPVAHECVFKGDETLKALKIDFSNGQKMQLKGTIDRVDYMETENEGYLTVIDYKSGQQSVDLVALYYGMQLQLFVYMNAMQEVKHQQMQRTVKPAGVFYFHLDDPIMAAEGHMDYEQVEAAILEQLKLKGLVVEDAVILKGLDANCTTSSNVIPIRYNKDGSLSKTSRTLPEVTFEKVLAFTHNKVKAIGADILSGEIEARPYKKAKETGCDYCAYLSICQFDKRLDHYRLLDGMTEEEALIAIVDTQESE